MKIINFFTPPPREGIKIVLGDFSQKNVLKLPKNIHFKKNLFFFFNFFLSLSPGPSDRCQRGGLALNGKFQYFLLPYSYFITEYSSMGHL